MDTALLFLRFVTSLICIFELILLSTAESLGMTDGKFPPKFNFRPDEKRDGSHIGPDVVSEFETKANIDERSMEQSKILEFIENIRTNSTEQKYYCNKSKEQSISLSNFSYTFTPESFIRYKKQTKDGVFIAKYLTNLLTSSENSVEEFLPAIISVLRIIIADDKNLAGGGIALSSKKFPYIFKEENGSLVEKDLSQVYKDYTNEEFYSIHKQTDTQLGSITIDNAYFGQPYFDCFEHKRWIAAISLPFFDEAIGTISVQPGALELKGVVVLDVDLEMTAVNQCEDSDTLFARSHKCRPETTKCKYLSGGGLEPGNYECHCKSGFFFPALNASQKFYSGTQVERYFLSAMRGVANFSTSDYQCLPCRQGCIDCDDDGPCLVEYNILMRGIPLGIQSFCMTITLVLGIVVLRVRKCKVMVIGMWCLLEIILLGALFLYATVVVQYFEPSTTTCLIVPWLRELGFAILYGALVLKIYRLLADFQSRKAHRVHVRDKDLLKYLLCVVVVVIGYMAAWTAVNIDQIQDGASLITTGTTSDDQLRYFICKAGWWDYSTEVAEVLFLFFGIYLCYRVRAAPSEYGEGTYISAAICYECLISTIFYILRHIYWLSLHPDYLFLMYFLRCQLTVSVTLVLVFGPKLWYAHRPPDERQIRNRAYSSSDVPDNMAPEVMKLNVGISSNGDVDVGDVSLADMDPEDIRAELKRLYTQLQVYKTRNMRKDNPHISKRRGGRKQTHRRFSLQAFHHKHRHHHSEHTDHDHEMSRTPEESTNSAEGVPMPIEMSVTKCDEVNEIKPTCSVSFKMNPYSHK